MYSINLSTRKLCYSYKMLTKKRTYKKHYVIGGAGIFDSIGRFLASLSSSNAAKQLALTALQVEQSAAKDIGMIAIYVGKTVAIDAGNKLIEKAAKKLLTPKSQEIITKYANVTVQPEQMVQNVNDA